MSSKDPNPEIEHMMRDQLAAQERCRCAVYGQDECEEHTAQPERFFVDHNMIHDRKTGRHVTALPPLHDELVRRVLSSPYHFPMTGKPESATEAYALAVLLICAHLEIEHIKASSHG